MHWLSRPRVQVWIAGVSLVCWAIATPITLITGLRSSLEWVVFMSLFANVATCFGWWVSSLVNVKADAIHEKVHDE
jgi:hypothetical protein